LSQRQRYLQSERDVATASLISLSLESLVLDDQSPPSEKRTAKGNNCEHHHDDESHKVSGRLAVVEEVRRNDVTYVATHIDLKERLSAIGCMGISSNW
jgi:hypothetical protein